MTTIRPNPIGLPWNPQQPQHATEPPQLTRDPNGPITLQAGAGNDRIRVLGLGDGRYGVTVNEHQFAFTREEMARLTIHAGDGDNDIRIHRNVDVPISVKSGAGNDRVFNASNGAMIDTGAGDDLIRNRAHGVKIHGGEGNDLIDHRGTGATLSGGAGDDQIRAFGEQNLVQGGDGHDALHAFGNGNYIRGGAGNDIGWVNGTGNRLEGNAGEDALFASGAYNQIQAQYQGQWDHVGVLGPNFVEGQLTQGQDLSSFVNSFFQSMLFRNVGPGAFAPPSAPGQEAAPAQGLVDGNGQAPTAFDALNVHRDLRSWTADCGARGCCKWEPAIA
jgi:Ca2+-binding RTX toxin-like protein